MKKSVFSALFGGVVCLASVSPSFAQQADKKGDSASFSFSGQKNGPIEVRGPDGKIIEVLMPSDVRLNQAPAHVLAREKAYRAKRQEESETRRELKKEAKRVAAEEAAEASLLAKEQRIVAAEKAAQLAADEADKPKNPYRSRRKTIRRKIVEDETAGTGTAPPKASP